MLARRCCRGCGGCVLLWHTTLFPIFSSIPCGHDTFPIKHGPDCAPVKAPATQHRNDLIDFGKFGSLLSLALHVFLELRGESDIKHKLLTRVVENRRPHFLVSFIRPRNATIYRIIHRCKRFRGIPVGVRGIEGETPSSVESRNEHSQRVARRRPDGVARFNEASFLRIGYFRRKRCTDSCRSHRLLSSLI